MGISYSRPTNHEMVLIKNEFQCPYCGTALNLFFKDIKYERKRKKTVPPGAKDLGLVDVWSNSVSYRLGSCPSCKSNYGCGDGLNYTFSAIDHFLDDQELGRVALSYLSGDPSIQDSILQVCTKTLADYDIEAYPDRLWLYPKGYFEKVGRTTSAKQTGASGCLSVFTIIASMLLSASLIIIKIIN